jgi:hypothetical protein
MRISPTKISIALLASSLAVSAFGQTPVVPAGETREPIGQAAVPASAADAPAIIVPAITPAVQLLRDFKTSEVKFKFADLMDVLRDPQARRVGPGRLSRSEDGSAIDWRRSQP